MAKPVDQSPADALFAEAEKNKRTKKVDVTQWKPDEKGDALTGWLRQIIPTVSTENDGEYNRYIFDSGNGLFSCAPGKMVDEVLGDGQAIGKIVQIRFDGQEALKGGRRINRYTVRIAEGTEG